MHIIVFDLETQNLFEDVGGRTNIAALRVSCAVTWSSVRNDFNIYWEKDVPGLIEELKSAGRVVGFNLKGFDYEVLRPYAPAERLQFLPTLDIMDDLFHTLSFRPQSGCGCSGYPWRYEIRIGSPGGGMVACRKVGFVGRILQGGRRRDPPDL